MNPHAVTRDFERALCEYTDAPFAVAVNSCTMALTLAVAWRLRNQPPSVTEVVTTSGYHAMAWDSSRVVEIPKRTYVSVPQAIIHAGGRPTFRDEEWRGAYLLRPLNVWDSARWFTRGMYSEMLDWEDVRLSKNPLAVCLSFHSSKTCGLEQGGAILHDSPEADAWFRKARFDGRTEGVAPKDDHFDMVAFHCYMNPSTAAQGLLKLHSLPKHNEPLENDDYPPLDQMEIFK